MTYKELKTLVKTGDVLAVRGSMFVRTFTAESYSHVAVLVWMPDGGLWVFEFKERCGFRSMPASEWFQEFKGKDVYWVTAPEIVHKHPDRVLEKVLKYRNPDAKVQYGWLSFISIWFSQLFNCKIPVVFRVCSTFVQKVWEYAYYEGFCRTADPGDIVQEGSMLIKLGFVKKLKKNTLQG